MTAKTYTVTMYRVTKSDSKDGSGRDTWTCTAASMTDAVEQFVHSGQDKGYMTATVEVQGGKRSYRVEQVDGYHAARRERRGG